ncbi:thiamine pyrophosphate-dependent enzyme [Roseospirillum parvum]|uniref:Acetolactate synthase-1/2/3 large subunit n=1 Tax=Roseospirillum parvum TaxID=83401 RepID=A0A1G7WXU9_9PROT|nr:thiamine pyrophosphate-dependent enzyme [Roseospirillum parvum]SDG76716.1 acetolactate synthase-1/2/3 large subunit [Roseospirillum parvum]
MTATAPTGARLLVRCLADQGAERIFGVPGESFLGVLDALLDYPDLEYVTCRQEGGAAMMAEAHGKLTGRPGLCLVTRGPGATNACAGVHVAAQDSTPMILMIGQVDRAMLGREAFQEIDFGQMFGPLAKWVGQVDDAARLPELIARAHASAMNGRPGPVVLTLPEDMLSGPADWPERRPGRVEPARAAPRPADVENLSARLTAARRPLLLVGGGGWTAAASTHLKTLAEASDLPVAAAFRRQDCLDNTHPCYAGHVGIGIDPGLAERLAEADLIVAVGPRLGEMTTGGYSRLTVPTPAQGLVHVHPDGDELGRVYQADLAIQAHPEPLLAALAAAPPLPGPARDPAWRAACRATVDAFSAPPPAPAQGPDLAALMGHLRQHLPDDAILCNGAGNYAIWLHRFFAWRQYGTQLAPTSGSMGYGLPAAIAAALARPQTPVVALAGDGCLMMTVQELATAIARHANLLLLVVNNANFGTIRMHQERRFPGRVSATTLTNPRFAEMARTFGAKAWQADTTESARTALSEALNAEGVRVLELICPTDQLTPTATVSNPRG